MNSFAIFIKRVKKDILFQYSIVKSVLDWTVLLYIIVPFSIAAIMIYRSWWFELPSWSIYITLHMIVFIVYLLSWTGHFRLFVKEADGVFLLKHRSLFMQFKKWTYSFFLCKLFSKTLVITVAILPFLIRQHSFTSSDILCFFYFYLGLSFFISACKDLWLEQFVGWKRNVLVSVVFIVILIGNQFVFIHLIFDPVYSIFISTLFISLSFIFYKNRIFTTRYFQQEVVKENEQRLRYMNMIFAASPEIEKPRIIKRKKPLMFRNSKRLMKARTPENGFIELFLKILIRDFSYLSGYFRLIGITLAAVWIIPPIIFKCIITGGFVYFIWYWISGLYNRVILSHPFGKKFENYSSYYQSRLKACLYLSIPAWTIMAGALLLSIFVK